jgi:hypothetical protein
MTTPTGPLGRIATLREVVSGRVSSWDRSGRNDDWWAIPPGGSVVIADLPGPGTITHLWLTQWSRIRLGADREVPDPDLLRTLVLRVTWDDDPQPAILVPVGDFFCLGDGIAATFSSLPFSASARADTEHLRTGHLALNCYLPMPFDRRAVVELINEGENVVGQYFQLDFELQRDPYPPDTGRLHASWRRDRGEGAWGPDLTVNTPETLAPVTLDPADNVTILEVAGDGQYIGCNLTVVHDRGDRHGLHAGEASWWGEGDDMIVVDGEPWPPRLHGTGSEDYFGHAWEMQPVAAPFAGSVVHEDEVTGVQVSYRFHLTDPVRFRERIHVSMERGHANHLGDDWSMTSYWYQRLPSPGATLASVAERLPSTSLAGRSGARPATGADRPDRFAAIARAVQRFADQQDSTEAQLRARVDATRAAELASREEVRALRRRTLG